MNLDSTAIRSVSFYVAAGPVETCDRCGTAIRNVFFVSYRDGEIQKYGSECINRILGNEPTLRNLFNKNAKLLKRYQDYLRILSGPIEQMPRGQEYYGSGLYMIADSDGKDIAFKHYYFHPIFDQDKNASGRNYIVQDIDARYAKCLKEIETDLPAIKAEITRLESFLGKILRSQKC